jgi:hypothetical protein
MYFTKPTAKSYIYDAHLSQKEMLQSLMLKMSTLNVAATKPYKTARSKPKMLQMVESIYSAIACTVLMLPLPADAAHIAEMSLETPVYLQLGDQHGKGNIINQVHVHDDYGNAIKITPMRI